MESPYLTVAELVIWLRLSTRNDVYRLKDEHGLPFRRMGKKLLFRKDEVDAWLQGEATLTLRRRRAG